LGYGAVVTSHFIKLSASAWVATITGGGGGGAGGKCLRVENSVVMEVEMFVEYGISEESIRPAFDWVGSCTPFVGEGGENIEAFWVWEAELHCFYHCSGGFVDGWGTMFVIR
jgi:hypothetical protein